MKIQRLIIVWVSAAVACVGASITAAQVPPAPYNPPPPQYNPPVPQYTPALPQYSPPAYQYGVPATGQVTAKNPLLLALVLQPLLQQTGASASSGIGMLFSRLFNALFGHKDPNSPPGAQYPGGAPYGSAAAGYPPSTPQYGTPYPGTPGGYPAGVPGSPPTAFGAPYGAIPATPYGAATPYPSGASGPAIPSYGSSTPTPYPTPAPGTPAATNPAFPGYPPAPGAPATTGAYAGASSSYTGAPPPGLPTTPGAKAAVLPSVLYSLEQLDPKTFKVNHSIDLGHGTPTLHTGDVFAIEYSTNVPGQVRIDNVDSTGTMSALGTYTVQSGHDNRIPVTKGMKLIGTTGTETFKLYFFPCLPTDAGGTTDSAAASAGLPTCPPGPSPQLLRASTGLLGAKAAVNLDSPDPTIAVNAFASYQTNDVTESDFQILHVAPGAASGAQSK